VLASFFSLGNIGAAIVLPLLYNKPIELCFQAIVVRAARLLDCLSLTQSALRSSVTPAPDSSAPVTLCELLHTSFRGSVL
jgi:hypothetical protein